MELQPLPHDGNEFVSGESCRHNQLFVVVWEETGLRALANDGHTRFVALEHLGRLIRARSFIREHLSEAVFRFEVTPIAHVIHFEKVSFLLFNIVTLMQEGLWCYLKQSRILQLVFFEELPHHLKEQVFDGQTLKLLECFRQK